MNDVHNDGSRVIKTVEEKTIMTFTMIKRV